MAIPATAPVERPSFLSGLEVEVDVPELVAVDVTASVDDPSSVRVDEVVDCGAALVVVPLNCVLVMLKLAVVLSHDVWPGLYSEKWKTASSPGLRLVLR